MTPLASASSSPTPLNSLLHESVKTCHQYVVSPMSYGLSCHGSPHARISKIDTRYGVVTSPTGGTYSGSIFRRSSVQSSDWELTYARGGGADGCFFVATKFHVPLKVLNEFQFCFDDLDFTPPAIDLVGAVPTTKANLVGAWSMHAGGAILRRNGVGDFSYSRFDNSKIQNNFYEIKFKVVEIQNQIAKAIISESNDLRAPTGSEIKLVRTQIGVTVMFPAKDYFPMCDQVNRQLGQCGA